jgi:hypothetical protein
MLGLKQSRSFTEADIPSHFFMVFTLRSHGGERVLNQIRQGHLEGVKGISDTNEILGRFLKGERNAFLKMHGPDVVRENALTRVLYDNIHYLVQSDMRAMQRIWDRTPYHIIEDLLGGKHIQKVMVKSGNPSLRALGFLIEEHLYDIKHDIASLYPDGIRSLRDLGQWFYRALAKVSTSKGLRDFAPLLSQLRPSDLEASLAQPLLAIASEFQPEGEWILKGTGLTIPKGSQLYVSMPMESWEPYQQWVRAGRFPLFPDVVFPSSMTKGLTPSEIEDLEFEYIVHEANFAYLDEVLGLLEDHDIESRCDVVYLDTKEFERSVKSV